MWSGIESPEKPWETQVSVSDPTHINTHYSWGGFTRWPCPVLLFYWDYDSIELRNKTLPGPAEPLACTFSMTFLPAWLVNDVEGDGPRSAQLCHSNPRVSLTHSPLWYSPNKPCCLFSPLPPHTRAGACTHHPVFWIRLSSGSFIKLSVFYPCARTHGATGDTKTRPTDPLTPPYIHSFASCSVASSKRLRQRASLAIVEGGVLVVGSSPLEQTCIWGVKKAEMSICEHFLSASSVFLSQWVLVNGPIEGLNQKHPPVVACHVLTVQLTFGCEQ